MSENIEFSKERIKFKTEVRPYYGNFAMIKDRALKPLTGKKVIVTIDTDQGTEVTQTIKEIDNTIMPVVV